jgi:sulfur carrier protein ThiS adenylyltransferase
MTIFERNIPGTAQKLSKFTVGIAGCGGLGSNIAVSLVRCGVRKIILADMDRVEASNLNRQHFFQDDIGKSKVCALEDHLKRINPDIEVKTIDKKLVSDDIKTVFNNADILFEAFDDASSKLWLIESWAESFPKRPVICGSGMSGLGEFSDIHVRSSGMLSVCGDEKTDMSAGLMAPKVAIVANLQAMTGIKVMLDS